jgi:predicted amino acid-binding ACT domain protein
MGISQVSIFLENRAGGLADVTDVLAQNDIDIRALTLADMADFGILRLIVDDPDRTRNVLKAAGFTADKTRVVAVEVPDKPGAWPPPSGRSGRERSTSSTCTSRPAPAPAAPSSSSASTSSTAPWTSCARQEWSCFPR